jgi:hypothetical protein
MAGTVIIELPKGQWTKIVDPAALFMLSVVSGPTVYVATTATTAQPPLIRGHTMAFRVKSHLNREDIGPGYVWAYTQEQTNTPAVIALDAGLGTLDYEVFQVDDGLGVSEDFQVSDGLGGHENYEVIQ